MSDSNSFKDIQKFLDSLQDKKGFDPSSNPDGHLLENLWSLSDDALSATDFNVDKAWLKFKKNNNIPSGLNWLKISVITVIIIASMLAVYFTLFNSAEQMPGYSPAVASHFNVEENLIDGSLLALVSSDDLEIDPEFSINKRRVRLNGNAYCNIQSDPDHPFEIVTEHGSIKVFGTSFLIEQEDGVLSVTVFEGIVEVLHPSLSTLVSKVEKGQKAVVFNKDQVILISEINDDEFTLILENTKVVDALRLLDHYQQVEIHTTASEKNMDCRITSRWNSSNQAGWQEDLSLLFDAKVTIDKEEILIDGLKCQD